MRKFEEPICTLLDCRKYKYCLLKYSVKKCVHYNDKKTEEIKHECKTDKNKKSIWTF